MNVLMPGKEVGKIIPLRGNKLDPHAQNKAIGLSKLLIINDIPNLGPMKFGTGLASLRVELSPRG